MEETETRDHWWWRPGWRPGRSFYTWHILVDDQPAIHEFAEQLQPKLAATGALGPIPLEWLHMTLQGVGFTDEVSDETMSTIAAAVSGRVAGLGPVPVTVGPPVVDPEGVNLPVRPAPAVEVVRRAVREGIADVWGANRVPEADDGFVPHVSLAYSHTSGAPLAPIRDTLARHAATIPAVLTRVSLLNINRDNGMYQWQLIQRTSLGSAATSRPDG
ncbi:2'-5' RNA ligase family protein [Nonomuraea turcica]|uniref:2'-5' RNA ligase family protein n=1 Tax=Nonomuraea sp. G32 TaxID=3067274 RepID=UPI00273B447A|nr:2'-5' RNA ligase family protein [Nonomuraea sp. G32]MDP4511746.1 2'-5' RNA ligase family protein [Nonomuraea sp. G32]